MSNTELTTELHPAWDSARTLLAGIKQALRISLAGQVLLGQELTNLKKDLGFRHGGDRKSSGQVVNLIELTWAEWVKQELGVSYRTADRCIEMFESAKARVKKIGITQDLPGGSKKLALLFDSRPSTMADEDREKLQQVVEKITCGTSQKELLEELRMVKHATRPQIGGDTSQHRDYNPTVDVEQLAFAFVGGFTERARQFNANPALPTYLASLPIESDDPETPSLDKLETETRLLLTEIDTARRTKITAMKRA